MKFFSARRFLLPTLGLIVFIPLISYQQPRPMVKSASTYSVPLPESHDIPIASLSATSVMIVDLATDSVLYQKNPDQRLSPASLTKIMTSLVALESYPEEQVLTAYSASDTIGSDMKLQSGDQLSARDLLKGLLIASANDAALTFAENYPGGYSAFISKMNQTAIHLGLVDTNFTNVSGVEDNNHFSTASDLTRLTEYALSYPLFAQIVSTKHTTVTSISGKEYVLNSTNELLGTPGVIGVKTGWTPSAGECLITLINRNEHPILITLMQSNDRFGETKKIIDWLYTNFSW